METDISEIRGELIEKLETAQEKLNEAIEILEEVANKTDDGYAKAYLIDHLKIMASDSHGFMSRDFNVDKWINKLNNEDEED